MNFDPVKFFKACNPNNTLIVSNELERRYYINFTKARSGKRKNVSLIDELYRTITRSDDRSHQLFTGHIGCGKSTELGKLKYELER
ncbi:MAG: ATP-binding protein, partial [Pseudanabaena sp. M051S1SP1A06QC]|nr:ATP-binding protein [Pseudanabaena sp. M051S1SP1A06QC]